MKRTILFLFFSLMFVIAQPSDKNNQAVGKGEIRGKINESVTKSPMEYVNIVVLDKSNGEMVNGTVTNKNGEFELKNIPNGTYEVKLSFMGYKRKTFSDITITNDNNKIKLDNILLEEENIELAEAQVVGEKTDVEFKIDKKVINVSQNINATGGSVIDVLQNQPSIQVDANGNVTLRGSGSFTVLMDGKPTPLQGSDALKQIPANIVDNVEIITNPSAKYDAEGTSGIINIVSKKLSSNSFNGIANASLGTNEKYGGDFTFNYRTPEYNANFGLDSRRMTNPQKLSLFRETFANNASTSVLNNDVNAKFQRDNYNIRGGIDLFLSDQNTLTINGSGGSNSNLNSIYNIKSYETNSTSQNFITDDKTNTSVKYVNGAIFFDHRFEPKISELTFESSLTYVDIPSLQTTKDYFSSSNDIFREKENNTTRYNSRIKLNYFLKFSEKGKLEIGTQTNLFYKESDLVYRLFDNNSQQWVTNNLTSDNFDFKNNVYAGFVTYENTLWGFDYQLGLRYEYNDRLLKQIKLKQDYAYSQGDFFPSVNLSTKLSESQQMQISYSRRVQRPWDGALNPIEDYSDDYTVIKGNPNLKSQFTNAFEVNYQYFQQGLYLTLQTYFRETNNQIEQVQSLKPDGKLYLMQDNVALNRAIGAEISANITITEWFKLDPSINLFHNKIEGNTENYNIFYDAFNWSARISSNLYLSKDTRIMIFANHMSKNTVAAGELKPITMIGATIRQDLFDKKLSFTLSANNLFNITNFSIDQKSKTYNSQFKAVPENSMLNLTVSYNFNNFKRSARGPERIDDGLRQGL